MSVCVWWWYSVFGQGSKLALVLTLYITVGIFSSFVCMYVCTSVCGGGILSLVRGVSSLFHLLSMSLSVYSLPLCVSMLCGSGILSLIRGVRSLLFLLSISLSVYSLPPIIFSMYTLLAY